MQLDFKYKEMIIKFDLEYRNRKTFSIEIHPPDDVKVISPYGLSTKEVIKIVEKKGNWIQSKLLKLKELDCRQIEKKYIQGEKFTYLGYEYYLSLILKENIKRPKVEIIKHELCVMFNESYKERFPEIIKEWYKEKALEKVIDRITHFQRHFQVVPRKIKIKDQKKRWGSCSSNKDLFFNWRCIMAPEEVLDYVIVHEMCHMVHMNHSKDFWDLVEYILPDYKERRKWLKDYGFTLNI